MFDDRLLSAGYQLMQAMDRTVDSSMPEDIASIVKTHSKVGAVAALGSAWLPGVGAIVAQLASAGTIWSMYARINSRIDLPFSENVMKSVASGVATNLLAYMVATTVLSSAVSLFPGMGSLGASALMAGLVYALTLASGFVYIKVLTRVFASGTDPTSLTAEQLKETVKSVFEHEDIKAVVKDAKQAFKSAMASGDIRPEKVEDRNPSST